MKNWLKNSIFFVLTGLFLIGLFCVFGNIASAATNPYVFTRNLTSGVVGDDVKELQKYLNTHGFVLTDTGPGSPGNETTKFGALTRIKLAEFQKANNISPAVGYFGPSTRALLNKLLADKINNVEIPVITTPVESSYVFTRNLTSGVIGDDVKELQKYLNTHGFVLTDTGPGSPGNETTKFGALTRITLVKFQKAKGIVPADGVFGVVTRKFINNQLSEQVKTGPIETGIPVKSSTSTEDTKIVPGYYKISGSVSGLIDTVTVQNNGQDSIVIKPGESANFTFSKSLYTGSGYNVTVISHSADQVCYAQNNRGEIKGTDVVGIKIACGAGIKLFYNPFVTNPYVSSGEAPVTTPIVVDEYALVSVSAISGTPQVGNTLSAGAVSPASSTVSYQWLIANTSGGTYSEISGATAATYTVQAGDMGKYIKLQVTGTGDYHGTVYSASTGVVAGITINTSTISGIAVPVRGATPVSTITETSQYTGVVTWSPNHSTFDSSTIYTATITLTAKSGYTFSGVSANFFTVASSTSVSNSANSGVVTAVFPITESVATFTWTGTGSKSFVLRGTSGSSITVDWGDSSSDTYILSGTSTNVTCSHTYASSPNTTTLSGDISSITLFTASSQSVSNISFSKLSGLNTLNVNGGSLRDISSISGLSSLTGLNISADSVTDLSPLSGLSNLTTLSVFGNNFSDISVLSYFPSLIYLDSSYNSIVTIPSTLPAWSYADLNFKHNSLSAANVDGILNKLYVAGANHLTLALEGSNAGRTSDSDTAYDWLITTGASTVTVNNAQTTITDIDTDETVTTTQTNVVLTGTGFRALQGTGSLILANSSTYSGATVTSSQSIDSWSDTSIQFDVTPGSLSAGTVYAFVTNKYGGVNSSGYAINLAEPPSATASLVWSGADTKTFNIRGTNGQQVTFDWGDASSTTYTLTGTSTDVACSHTYSSSPNTTTISGDITDLTYFSTTGEPGISAIYFSQLSNLNYLSLNNNYSLASVSSLSSLSNLRSLILPGNNLSSIAPLASLTGLTSLTISSGNLPNASSTVVNLVNLQSLTLYYSGVTDITFLSALVDLTDLDLRGNDISVLPSSLPAWTFTGWHAFYFNNAGLNSTEVDQMLNLFYNASTTNLNIDLAGSNSGRTSVSDAAYDWLTTTGGNVITVNNDQTTITDIDTDETVTTTQTNVVLTGTGFRATQGTGKLILANNATYASATVTSSQSIDSWSDTSIQFDVTPGSLSAGTVYAFVTNKYGGVNSTGYAVSLVAPPVSTVSFAWSGTSGEKNFILQGTADASITVDWGDASSTIYTMTGSDVTCVHTYSGSSGTTTLSGDIGSITFVRFNNVLSNISLASLTSLQSLYITGGAYGSSITLDSIADITTLRNIYVEGSISDHSISALTNLVDLQQLYVPENGITDISVLANMPDLNTLALGYNNISVIPDTFPTWTGASLNFNSAGLDSTEVDDVLNKLYTAGANNLTLNLAGSNGARTSASDAAYNWLTTTGASTVTVN